jgi:hypothetical protein
MLRLDIQLLPSARTFKTKVPLSREKEKKTEQKTQCTLHRQGTEGKEGGKEGGEEEDVEQAALEEEEEALVQEAAYT